MNVKIGDEIFLRKSVYVGFSQLLFWEKVVITRTTKTLFFVGDVKFKKHSLGVDFFEINDETTWKAMMDNDRLEHNKLKSRFINYKWEGISLRTLRDINEILLLVENYDEEQ